ncbi:flagellar hook-associated 2 domain protein [Nitrosococcus halophilus Nc 4]|uniref:Flagellar hook-associated protein 2 n=1 Tax=Nitrosococcus halophilus (strain Nc4) TaxID=472759 RepID=D5BV76_NITHN|nr:flagellar filament capping protein FliD [Nitrosococcus halophilus]ADE15426.1 flagellar hook-associated 2 domain protein [Nitrosococcus halophilus Nc 4]
MITSAGVGSGLDIESLVSQLVAAEGQPQRLRLDRREARLQTTLSAMGTLKSELANFQNAVSGLSSLSAFQGTKASVGNTSLLTASATAEAATGTYSVEVQQLAQAQKLASKTFADSHTVISTGTLSFRFGTYDGDSNTFTANPDKSAQVVTIDAAHSSLSGIRDAVNGANIGVSASIVNDGAGDRLVFTSKDMGVANSLQITVGDGDGTDPADNVDDDGLSQLAYDPTAPGVGSGKNLTETVAAQDARLLVDGLTITRPTNTATGVIEGVTLNLKSAESGSPTTLTVASDGQAISKSVNSFVDSYNSLVESLNSLSSYNPETRERGALLGDASLRGIENRIRRLMGDAVAGLSGPYRALADIGITTQREGTLALEESKLQSAIETHPEAIARLFAVGGEASDPLVRFVEGTETTRAGEYEVNISQLATQGKYTGNATGSFPITIDADNDEFTLKVDGSELGTISLTHETYNNGSELAAALQSQINSNPKLSEAGGSVAVEFVSDHLEMTSSRYGSASSVEILSLDPSPTATTTQTLGLTVNSGNAGVDVAGTIGGQAAVGSGRFLTGSGGAEGVKLEVLGGAVGDRGSVAFSRGVAAQLNTYLEQISDSDGFLDNRIDGLNDRVADLGEQREVLDRRLVALEQRYRAQFTALDSLLGQLQTTSNFLSQQIAALPRRTSL